MSTATFAPRRASARPYRAASLRQVLGDRLTRPLRAVWAWSLLPDVPEVSPPAAVRASHTGARVAESR